MIISKQNAVLSSTPLCLLVRIFGGKKAAFNSYQGKVSVLFVEELIFTVGVAQNVVGRYFFARISTHSCVS